MYYPTSTVITPFIPGLYPTPTHPSLSDPLGPQMIHCISQKMTPQDFEGHDDTSKDEMMKTKTDRNRYYEKLGSAMFGVCLPGLGYDTFRMWELLTMGTVIILERAVGFDRTVSTHY